MTEQACLSRSHIRSALAAELVVGEYFAQHFSSCVECQFPSIRSHVYDSIALKQGLRPTKNFKKKLSVLRLTFKLAPVLATDST